MCRVLALGNEVAHKITEYLSVMRRRRVIVIHWGGWQRVAALSLAAAWLRRNNGIHRRRSRENEQNGYCSFALALVFWV